MVKTSIRLFAYLVLVTLLLVGWSPLPAWAVTDYLQEQAYLNSVWQLVNRNFYDRSFNHQNWYKVRKEFGQRHLENRADTYQAIREMLAVLNDPFTRLLEPDQFLSLKTSTEGEITGVGLQIAVDTDNKGIVVIAPIENSPADRAGIRALDRILAIDDVPTAGMTLDECAARMRGAIGSIVTLLVGRPLHKGEISPVRPSDRAYQDAHELSATGNTSPELTTFKVQLQRDRIAVSPVISKLNLEGRHKVAYIRLNQFNGNAATAMATAIHQLEAQGAEAYVLDLRSNPGGLFDASLEIAREWLDEGVIVFTVDRHGISETFTANHSALTSDPLAVLIDGGTASASEVLAGALQENHRAKLVGTRSFGKALIQSLYELPDGAGLAVTIARYETPQHHDINRRGIIPDLEVTLDQPLTRSDLGTARDRQYVAAVQSLFGQSS
ncbi:MAG: S41 family peptidase [Pseudanabaenaceae cyanobacterium]